MNRPIALAVMLTFVLGACFIVAPGRSHAYQSDAAPNPLAGVTIEALSSGTADTLDEHSLLLMRMTMEPGVSIPAHRHPGPVALTVLSGTFGTEIIAGEGELTRAAADGTPAAPEPTDLNEQYTLQPGDSLFYEETAHTMVNAGDEPLVLLIAAVFDPAQPGFIFLDGTPTP